VLKKTIFSLAIGWTILIAFLCLVKFNNLPTFSVSNIDKYVHFSLHFVFTFLWGYYSWLAKNNWQMKQILIVIAISLFYGIAIEILQETCTKTRHADINDVLANSVGALAAFVFFYILKERVLKHKS
jgi:VanZ family protein